MQALHIGRGIRGATAVFGEFGRVLVAVAILSLLVAAWLFADTVWQLNRPMIEGEAHGLERHATALIILFVIFLTSAVGGAASLLIGWQAEHRQVADLKLKMSNWS